MDFKNNCLAGGCGGNVSNNGPTSTAGTSNFVHSLTTTSTTSPPNHSDISHQFNIFPAIFSRQLNFASSTSSINSNGSNSSNSSINGCDNNGHLNLRNSNGGPVEFVNNLHGKLMDDLRPNLVGGLLGLQQGLLDDHALAAHGNLQHSAHHDTKFMSLQDNRLMGFTTSHENRLLGLSQDLRSAATMNNLDNSKTNHSVASHQNRKCSSTPEDFSALYGGLTTSGIGDTSSHHHTPAHTPPSRLGDHTITGKTKMNNV